MTNNKKGPPPIVGKCALCGTVFNSKYAMKTHRCKKTEKEQ